MANEMAGSVGSNQTAQTVVTLSPSAKTLEIATYGSTSGDRTCIVINGETVAQAIMANGSPHHIERDDAGISTIKIYAQNNQTDQVYALLTNRIAFRK